VTKNYLELLRASEGTLIRWSRLHLQSLAPTNPHWPVMGYGPFSLYVIHKEGLCPSSGDIKADYELVYNVATLKSRVVFGTEQKNRECLSLSAPLRDD
jgi:hypothetical protein